LRMQKRSTANRVAERGWRRLSRKRPKPKQHFGRWLIALVGDIGPESYKNTSHLSSDPKEEVFNWIASNHCVVFAPGCSSRGIGRATFQPQYPFRRWDTCRSIPRFGSLIAFSFSGSDRTRGLVPEYVTCIRRFCCVERYGAEISFSSKTVALFPFRFPIVINAAHLIMLVFRNIFRLRSDKRICPNCSSQEIYLSHRKNHFEKSLSVFLIRPFRCRQCHRRFWKFISPNSQMRTGRPNDLQKS